MHIRVECKRPKYAAGDHEFTTFEQVFAWLEGITGIAKGAPGHWLYGLADSGHAASTAGCHVRMESDVFDHALAVKVGEKVRLLSYRFGGRRVASSRELARSFALEWDRSVLATHS